MKIRWVGVTGICGAVYRGQGVVVHGDLCGFICVHTGRGHGSGGGGPPETPTSTPSSRWLLGVLGSGPACGSGAGGQYSHQNHKESSQED